MSPLVITALDWLLRIIEYAIIARVIISWLPIPRDNPFIRLLFQFTEPILAPIRAMIEKSSFGKNMMIDFSPIIAFLLMGVIRSIVVRLLMNI